MKIVTGYTGTPHIDSNDQQAFNQGIFGIGNIVLNIGQKFAATINTATTITIEDGEGVMQGVHFRIETGKTETVTISSGTPGYNRIDLVCARYTKEPGTGTENVELIVIEGNPSTDTPSEPAYNTGNILSGESPVDFPLWKITITGLTPTLTNMFIGGIGAGGIIDMVYPVGSIYMSVNDINPASIMGGTWERLKDRFLLGAGDTYVNGNTGGEATHTLTANEIPAHTHQYSFRNAMAIHMLQTGSGFSLQDPQTNETSSVGGGQAHNNMPPYLVVYMWKRTA